MLQVHLFDPETGHWRQIDAQLLRYPLDPEEKVWADLSNAHVEEQQALMQKLAIHPMIAEDFLRDRHPPKLEANEQFTLLILRAFTGLNFVDYPGHSQISLLFSANVLLAKGQQTGPEFQRIFSSFEPNRAHYAMKDWVKHYIHNVSASYLEKLINFEDELGDFEDLMLTHGDDHKMSTIMKYRTVFRKLERNLAYQKEMFADLLTPDDGHPFVAQFQAVELRDFYEKFERLHSMTQMYYDQLGDLVNAYMSTSSHQINERMKLLTMVSTVFIPLTFIAGVYGMNFDNMPELKLANGYFWTLAGMAGLAIGMLVGFKIKRWW